METPQDRNRREDRSDRWPNDLRTSHEANKLNPDNPGDRYIQSETRDRHDASEFDDDFYGLREIDRPTGFTSVDKTHYYTGDDPDSRLSTPEEETGNDFLRFANPDDDRTRFASHDRDPDPEEFF